MRIWKSSDGSRRRGPGLAKLARILASALALQIAAVASAAAGGFEARATARVAASPERTFAVLADFDRWDRIFSGFRLLRHEPLAGGHARLRQQTAAVGRTVTYTVAATVAPEARRIDFALDPTEPHDVAEFASSWRIEPLPDGGSRIELEVVSRSGLPVPAVIERRVVQSKASGAVADLAAAVARSEVADTQIGLTPRGPGGAFLTEAKRRRPRPAAPVPAPRRARAPRPPTPA